MIIEVNSTVVFVVPMPIDFMIPAVQYGPDIKGMS